MPLETHNVDINSINQDPRNARTHTRDQLENIAASLKRFGLQKPIVVDANNVIIAGNGTHLAARDILGWTTIDICYSDLSSEEARAYGISDNALALQSEWNFDTLTEHIQSLAEWNPLQDWKAIGFDEDIIAPILEEDSKETTSDIIKDFMEGNESSEDSPQMAKPIKVTTEQKDVINQAIQTIKIQTGDFNMSEGRALELLCADFLGGVSGENNEEFNY